MGNVIDLEEYKRLKGKKEYWAKIKRKIEDGTFYLPPKAQIKDKP